ncbi:MAG: hypothetical protein ACREER_06790 [Alphaproteobacteria bacterium]
MADDQAPRADFAGRAVEGSVTVGGVGAIHFTEHLAPDGTLAGRAGPPGEPDRWRWTGTWSIVADRLCRTVPAVNVVACLIVGTSGGAMSLRPTIGKLGAAFGTVTATLMPDGIPLAGWTAPAAIAFALGGGPGT